jgi:hypothetical protein
VARPTNQAICILVCVFLLACGPPPEPEEPPLEPGPPAETAEVEPVEVEEPEPETSLVALEAILAGEPAAGTVHVKAELDSYEEAETCSTKKKGCVPHGASIRLEGRREDGGSVHLAVAGSLEHPNMVYRWTPYTFVLELEEEYGEKVKEHGYDTGQLGVSVSGCLDCPVPREATIAQLDGEPEEPGFAIVKAYFVEANTPPPCPPKHKCQPAASTTILGEVAGDLEALHVCGLGLPAGKKKKLKKDTPYSFILQLHDGYSDVIGSRKPPENPVAEKDNSMRCGDPRWHPVVLFGCLDCPVPWQDSYPKNYSD